MEPVITQGSWEFREWLRAARHRFRLIWLDAVWLISFLGVGSGLHSVLLFAVIGVVFIPIYDVWILPQLWWVTRKSVRERRTATVDDDGLLIDRESSCVRLDWSQFTSSKETSESMCCVAESPYTVRHFASVPLILRLMRPDSDNSYAITPKQNFTHIRIWTVKPILGRRLFVA